MPTFIVERHVPGAGTLSAKELKEMSATSNAVIARMGSPYKWITSYVAGDKMFCIHEAESIDMIRRHAREGGFPADMVAEVTAIIGPGTAK